ncbi:uncharacterized protein LOC113339437 [Papaver somniferum]|uniref:uncharacterized protein LOC113339437 n=1 Tax=Papaver somniferum TaxID=3469 RepID=UPI000E7029A7|nr:uncharacterized protein LOC113339437 [Papaver somniferum]
MSTKLGVPLADDSDDEDTKKNLLMLYQCMLQHTHNLHQPVPTQVAKRESINKNRAEADARLMQDYFIDGCTWGPKNFHGRLGIYRPLLLKIMNKICEVDPDFGQRKDAARIPVHSPHMKMYAIMKCLCKGIPPDSIDDYTRMAASTIYYYIKKFCDAIMFGFNAEYMRRPIVNDVKWLMKENAARGFPEMLGSLDCMHCGWRVCPLDEAGTHTGHKSYHTRVLEAVASYDRWFWHGYFGVGGSSNDLNVLKSSNLFDDNLNGIAPPCHFTINGNQYTQGYYLVDGIYKSYSVLVQAYGAPSGIPILELFNKYQMENRKDVERAFGTLQKDEHRDPEWKYVPDPPHAPIVGYLRQKSEALYKTQFSRRDFVRIFQVIYGNDMVKV